MKIIGNPNEYAKNYYEDGADEILFMDCVATLYGRNNLSDVIFKATKDSYHGTNFPNGLDSYRIIYGAELTNA